MNGSDDIERIVRQESRLVFNRFSEADAFSIGCAIRERAVAEMLGLVVDIRLWDRPLFYCALPGTTADNVDWVRRKANTVRRFGKSTYRQVLERKVPDRLFPIQHALAPDDYVLAGGGFPIRIEAVGIIGSATVSGLPERVDHEVVVRAIAEHLGQPYEDLALSRE